MRGSRSKSTTMRRLLELPRGTTVLGRDAQIGTSPLRPPTSVHPTSFGGQNKASGVGATVGLK